MWGYHSWVSELGHPEVRQIPCPKEPRSENLQAQFRHNKVSRGTVTWGFQQKTCQDPISFQLLMFQGLEIIEKFYVILFKYKIWIVRNNL